jgi:uncharacterized protein YkwD
VVRQQRLIWLAATFLGAVAAAIPTTIRADVGSPIPGCLPFPTVADVTPACDQGSQPQSTPSSSVQGTESSKTAKQFSVAATPELARTLLAEVNRTRRAHGLRALAYSAPLSDAATAHVRALATAGQFTHAWPTTGRLFSSWIRSFYPARGYRAWSAGENLLWASPGFSPPDAVQQWLDSPVHRRVMLTPAWRELGIGVVSAVGAPGAYGERDVQIAAAEFGARKR